MKMLKKHLSTAIAMALTLTIAASMMTLPFAFGAELIDMSVETVFWPYERTPDNLYLVGVNQTLHINAACYPLPTGYVGNLTFRFTMPNGTTQNIVKPLNRVGEVDTFDFVPNQLGAWSFRVQFAGDAERTSAQSGTQRFTAQTAQVPEKPIVKTYAYVSTVPKTAIGLGQGLYIVGWLTPPRETSGAVFQNVTFTLTKPNGATATFVRDTNSEASTSFSYVVDQLGEWSIKISYAGDAYHTSAESVKTITVQEEEVPLPPQQPLPTGPWSWPITSEFYEWYQISGSWLTEGYNHQRNNFNPYTRGPNTPHILWKRQMVAAGMAGETGYSGIYADPGYVPVAAFGKMYLQRTEGYGDTQHNVIVCVDQFTGEVVWERALPTEPGEPGDMGILYVAIDPELKIDPKLDVDLDPLASLFVCGGGGIWELGLLNGEILWYLAGENGIYDKGGLFITNYPVSGNMTRLDPRTKEPVWNMQVSSPDFIGDGIIFDGLQGRGEIPFGQQIRTWNATTGELIVEGPELPIYSSESPGRTTMAYGKWYFHSATDLRAHAIDLITGREVWKSEPNEAPWGTFGSYVTAAAYGNYYQGTWDGYLSCYDAATGATKWRTYLGDNNEVATGNNVPWGQPIIADGKIYIASSEHTAPTPAPRGNLLYCLDAHNGEIKWTMPMMFERRGGGISSGILYVTNQYDGAMYNFGKGPSAITVSASPKTIAKGASVVIEGTVTDQSPGAKDTPAIADASMGPWMQYLYMNYPMPTDCIGVPVFLQAMLSDGSVIDIGHATSDIMGHYEYAWTPPDQDTYKILATFEGSESYWMSSAQTALLVGEAPQEIVPVAAPDNTNLLYGIFGGVAAAIVIGLVAVFLSLRKK